MDRPHNAPLSPDGMRMRRELRLFDIICIGINGIVGSGIFLYPDDLARLLGGASPLAFVLAAGAAAVIAMCLAELGSRFDRTGGPMVYAREGVGPWAGFAVGWLNFLAFVAIWAAVARGVGRYTASLMPWSGTPAGEAALAIGIIAAFTALNYVGIRPAAWVTNAFTVGKLLPLALLAVVGLAAADWSQSAWNTASAAEWGRAWFLCMFAMSGYENVGLPAGETRDPMRIVPIGILGAVGGAALIYIAVQTAVVGVLPGIADSKVPLADAAAAVLGPAGAMLLSVAAVVSMVGFISGSAILTPRALVALAEYRDLPAGLATLHPRYGSPHRAILLSGGIAIALAAVLGFGELADFGLVTVFLCYALSCAGLLRLRRRVDLPPPRFRIPAAPVMVTAAVGISLLLATQAGWADVAWALGLLAAGFALRYGLRIAWKPPHRKPSNG